MERAFFDVVSEVRLLQLLSDRSHDFKTLKTYLKAFEKVCMKNKDANYLIAAFQNHYHEEMSRIVFFLRAQKTDKDLRAFHDRIFTNIFHIGNRVPRNVTRVFDDFVKGITYFDYENPAQEPIYHRLHACGNGTNPFRQQYNQCTGSMDRKTKKDVKSRIEKCFLERIIYDRLFQDLELTFDKDPEQDEGHVHRMKLTQDDFESCFPQTKVEIDIEYDNHLPFKLTIARFVKSKEISREIYIKRIVVDPVFGGRMYYEIVDCYKHIGGKIYNRYQGYGERPKRWMALKHRLT